MNSNVRIAAYALALGQYKNSDFSNTVDEWIHSERDRAIMKRKYIDGITYERIAEEFDLTDRQVKNIVRKCLEQMFP